MTTSNRIYGCAIVKSINANYNADFSGMPRTLPSGTVYATDKAFKYSVKHFMKHVHNQKVYYTKSLNDKGNPISLDETYVKHFGAFPKKVLKEEIATNLLSCIDVRLFGATFAGKTNVSIHGPLQVNHGVNIWHENSIYSEQITSPFSNKSGDADAEKGMTTIGRQSRLEEGHYLHHFSINPQNLQDIQELAGAKEKGLNSEDLTILKDCMKKGATYYDSASKIGVENEVLIWVELKEGATNVLPNFSTLIKCGESKEDEKVIYDLEALEAVLEGLKKDIQSVELSYNSTSVGFINDAIEGVVKTDILTGISL